MEKNEVVAQILMETTTEPMKPKNIEVVDRNGLYYVRFYTCLQTFNIRNRNGRTYMGGPMNECLNEPHIQELIRKKAWLGEYGHPLDTNMARVMTIDPKLASHKITSLDLTNDYAKGWIETLPDGYGRNFTNNILQGMEPAFSFRGLASVTRRGREQIIQSKPRGIAYDAVILPSHPEAYRDESISVELKTITAPITESAMGTNLNSLGNTMEDSKGIIVTESQIIDFIKEESKNVKLISDIYEVCNESMSLTKDCKNAILREGNQTFYINIEDKIKYEVNNYMANL